MSQRQDIPLGTMNVSVSARQARAGTLRAAVNVVPAGPAESPRYEVAEGAVGRSDARRLLACAEQVRQTRGALADTDADPGQSLERLLGLTDEELLVIDPGQDWQAKSLRSFAQNDASRFMQVASVGRSHYLALSSGPRHQTPDAVWEVRDDAALPLSPPKLPRIEVASEEVTSPDKDEQLLSPGEYVFRFGWTLKDGTTGPIGGPRRIELSGAEGSKFRLTFSIDEYTYALPEAWRPLLTGIACYVQPPLTRDPDGDPRDGADRTTLRNPAYRVTTIDGIEVGAETEWVDETAQVLTYEVLDQASLLQHTVKAASAFSYNQRLLLGDVGFDWTTPALRQMLGWREGEDNAGGNDYWVRLRVELATLNGTFYRYSEPVPLDEAHAQAASFEGGLLYYPDSRAERWEVFVSEDYVPGSEPGTWGAAVLESASRAFNEGGGNYAFVRLEGTYDLRTGVGGGDGTPGNVEPIQDQINGTTDIDSSADYLINGTPDDPTDDTHHSTGPETESSYYDFAAPLAQGTTIKLTATAQAVASGHEAEAAAYFKVHLLDDNGDVVSKAIRHATVDVYEQDDTITQGGDFPQALDASGVVRLEIELHTEALVRSGGGKANSTASAGAEVTEARVVRPGDGGEGEQRVVTGAEIAKANNEEEHDPNRLLVSSTTRPRELLARGVHFVGDGPSDGIVGMAAATMPASEGQFGSFPVYFLCRESGWRGQVDAQSDAAFVGFRKVSPRGCVGRGAFTNLDRQIVFASSDGIYQLAPELGREPISAPLHGGDEAFLSALGPDTALGYYRDGRSAGAGRGRRELWVAAGALTFAFSMRHGAWTILDRERRSWARYDGRLLGTRPLTESAGGRLYEEGASTAPQPMYLQTSRLYLGEGNGLKGTWKRVRTFWLRQGDPLDNLTWHLSAYDPSAGKVELQSSPMTGAPFDTFTLGTGMMLEGELELIGEGTPGQSVEAFGLAYDVRMPGRRPGTTRTDRAASWSAPGGIRAGLYTGTVPHAPTFDSTPVSSVSSGGSYAYSVAASDPDEGDTPAFELRVAPSWLSLTDHGDGTATVAGTAPAVGFERYDVTLVATDGAKETEQTFEIIVTGEVALDFTDPDNAAYAALLS